jgi:hypothetical protein
VSTIFKILLIWKSGFRCIPHCMFIKGVEIALSLRLAVVLLNRIGYWILCVGSVALFHSTL